ncbi:MAG: rane protein [Proteobacteria bacterium]|nr:rane protein [Pseudomonadota bacterium]
MDNDIRVLEKIGLQEVCKRTHIEVKQLEYMINNQYDKLNKINTLGFIKILSREYKLDLTDWLEGFHDYWAEHKAEEDSSKEKIFIRAKSDRPYKKAAWLFLLIFLIAGVFGLFSIFKIEIDFDVMSLLDKAKIETNQTSAFQSAPVVQEAATSLGVKVEERVIETNSSNSTVQAVVVSIDENLTRKTEANDTNATNIPLSMLPESNTTLLNTVPKNNAIIAPIRRIWIGIVNLETFARKESSNDQNITIDLNKRQIIKTGNGFFKLSYDGSIEDFTEQGSTRFLVENGTMKKISEEKFIELNRGKNW